MVLCVLQTEVAVDVVEITFTTVVVTAVAAVVVVAIITDSAVLAGSDVCCCDDTLVVIGISGVFLTSRIPPTAVSRLTPRIELCPIGSAKSDGKFDSVYS